MPDVRLPDGTIIRNVPEGTTKAQLMGKINQMRGGQDGSMGVGGDIGGTGIPGPQDAESAGRPAGEADVRPVGIPSVQELLGGRVAAGFDPLRTVLSSAAAEPVAGVAGVVQAINPLEQAGAGARAVETTREALTIQPPTEAAKAGLAQAGEALQPVGEAFKGAEDFLGEGALDLTGSPALAAAAKTLPTAVFEALGGLGAFRRAAKTGARLKRAGADEIKTTERQVNKAIVEAAPDVDVIKDTSRAIYKEIDDLGVTVKPKAFEGFLNKVIKRAKKERVNPRRTPKAAGAVEEFASELDSLEGKTISDFDDLRRVAQDAASSIDPADARIGNIMLDEIDDFLDRVGNSAFTGAKAAEAAGVGKKFNAARKLWGRARRAELIQEAMGKADLQASGFENGIRTQLRQIVTNKKRSRFFTGEELDSMKEVIKGTTPQNVLKLVGRLGFSEGQATNIVGGLGGAAVLGPGAPVVGQASRWLAQRATRKGVELSDAIIRSGKDGKKIVEAYLKTTPKAKRSVSDLSEILLDRGAEVDELLKSASKATREAAELTKGRRAFITGAAAAGAVTPQEVSQ